MKTSSGSSRSVEPEQGVETQTKGRKRNFVIRRYRPQDREAVRRICCETGFLGNPIDPIFEDRELFADFLTAYYTDYEPESCLVAEAENGELVGYLIACCRPRRYRWMHPLITAKSAFKAVWRLITFRYSRDTRKYLWWLVLRGWREVPAVPSRSAAHFHLNMLPGWRQWRVTLDLLAQFREDLRERGVRQVYGQMVIPPGRRPPKVFERFGWEFYDTRPLTKFRDYVSGEFRQATIWTRIDD